MEDGKHILMSLKDVLESANAVVEMMLTAAEATLDKSELMYKDLIENAIALDDHNTYLENNAHKDELTSEDLEYIKSLEN